ncbi:MAG: AEC family transporter [Halopseudomonas sp.]
MFSMLVITTPIFLLIALGYVVVKAKVISAEANIGFGRFVLYFGLPALIFRAISPLKITEMLNPGYVGGYAIGSLLAFTAGLWISRRWSHIQRGPRALAGMGMSVSNSGFIGYPLMLLTFATPPVAEFAMVLLVENLLMVPMTLALLEYGASRGNGNMGLALWKPLAKRVLGSPVILAILSGVAVSLLDIPIPAVLDQSLEMLAGAAAPIALFAIGGSLVGASVRGTGRQTASIVVGKLVLHPLFVALALSLMPGVSPEHKITAILFAAMPMASIFPVIGGSYGHQLSCSTALLVTTVAAFFSITLFLSMLL